MCDFPEIKRCSKFHSIHISAEKEIAQQSQYAGTSHITDEQGIREEVVLKILGEGGMNGVHKHPQMVIESERFLKKENKVLRLRTACTNG